MKLIEKFKTGQEFVAYAEYVSGYDFDNAKLTAWFDKNNDFTLSYTGIMQAIRPFVVGKLKTAGKTPGQSDEPIA